MAWKQWIIVQVIRHENCKVSRASLLFINSRHTVISKKILLVVRFFLNSFLHSMNFIITLFFLIVRERVHEVLFVLFQKTAKYVGRDNDALLSLPSYFSHSFLITTTVHTIVKLKYHQTAIIMSESSHSCICLHFRYHSPLHPCCIIHYWCLCFISDLCAHKMGSKLKHHLAWKKNLERIKKEMWKFSGMILLLIFLSLMLAVSLRRFF